MNLRLICFTTSLAVLLAVAVSCWAIDESKPSTIDAKYAGMSWGPLGRASLAELPDGTLLAVGDVKITKGNLADEIAKAPSNIQPQLNTYPFFALEQMATRKLLSIEAAAWADKNKVTKKSDELMGAYLESVADRAQVSDEEVEKFRKDNQSLLESMPLEQQKSEVKKFLLNEKQSQMLDKYVKSIGGRHEISVSAAWVEAESQKWVKNPVEQARKSGKPSLLDFGAEWCMPCKQMAPIIDSLKEEYKDKVNIVVINADKEPILSTVYGADSIPLLLFFDADGKEYFRHNGFLDKKVIEEKLKPHVQ